MIDIPLNQSYSVQEILFQSQLNNSITINSLEEKVKLLILRDLFRIGWDLESVNNNFVGAPPKEYSKDIIRASMQLKRNEILSANIEWINNHQNLISENLANGESVLTSDIEPIIEECKTTKQHEIFRFFRYYWSSPYSEYVGRRIRLLIRDAALPNKPLIGIAAIGSSIIHIPTRDNWIGWDIDTRSKNLIYTMDAYVVGALPPYNYLLGGKLISYILASNEVRKIFEKKYENKHTIKENRVANKLACLFTTSLYGQSSQYNRIKYNDKKLFIPIGYTEGYGTLHLSTETFFAMRELLDSRGIIIQNRFGDGPIWTMRVIRATADLLNLNSDFLLKHSFKRGVYVIPLAENYLEYLNNDDVTLRNFDYPLTDLVNYWKTRWFFKRKENKEVKSKTVNFTPDQFTIN